jgi:hypothetical protein
MSTHFDPDNLHCPKSCLCPLCKNDIECEIACKYYLQMANECNDCDSCKVRI